MTTSTRTGASALIDALAAQGATHLFGIPGVHTLLPYDLLHDHPTIRPVVTRHEGAAGFAADGYARTTGRPGVCLVVPGPGTTNLSTAALVARSDSVPLVLITAAVPDALDGRYAIHELDIAAFLRPVVKAQIAVTTGTAAEITEAIAAAFALALAERPGPVHLHIPYDFFARQETSGIERIERPMSEQRPDEAALPDHGALDAALSLLRDAKAPLIYAGHGVVRAGAGEALAALAEALGAPVITSNKARGIIPEDHPLAVGVPSMAGVAAIARDADLCLALGTHFNEYTTLTWKTPLPANLIRVDRDPAALAMNYPAAVAINGDVASVLDWLLERLPASRAPSALVAVAATLHERRRIALDRFMADNRDPAPPFHPRFVARLLRETFPPDSIATSDGSATESWLYEPGFVVTRTGSVFVPEVQQTMGYAVGAALGAALGAPERSVVAVVGDGSLMMTLGELATIAAMRVPITIAVFNDGQYNALRVRQEAIFDRRFVGTALGTLDYAQVARGLGMRGEKIVSATQLRHCLADAAMQREPLLLDIPITPEPLSERYTAVIEAGG
ncbi:MAG: thiamine pyrophosphate-binding protein [Chloroflexota bacterium]|nr:thiamine pyrophosphate-binding protein [Chloroflexota bacterium]